MNILKNTFPVYRQKYKCKNIYPISEKKYLKNVIKIFLILFYLLCFGLGTMMYTYHSNFINSAFYFLVFLIASFFIIIPLHILIHVIALPGRFDDKDLYVGFNKKYLNFFVIYNKPISKKRFLISTLLPFVSISLITLLFLLFLYTNMFVYSLFCSNALLSVQDIYDTYILLNHKDKKIHTKYIKIENSIYKTNR